MSDTVKAMLKAIAGALVAGLTSLQASLDDGIDAGEWIAAAIATLVGLAVVWTIPNLPPSMSTPASPEGTE